jgi:hypothetical protein
MEKLVQPRKQRKRIHLWAEEEIRSGELPPLYVIKTFWTRDCLI